MSSKQLEEWSKRLEPFARTPVLVTVPESARSSALYHLAQLKHLMEMGASSADVRDVAAKVAGFVLQSAEIYADLRQERCPVCHRPCDRIEVTYPERISEGDVYPGGDYSKFLDNGPPSATVFHAGYEKCIVPDATELVEHLCKGLPK